MKKANSLSRRLKRPTPLKFRRTDSNESAFTIVELLVVIVIIGILAAITIVSYSGITQKANNVSLISDLTNASTQLKSYNALYGSYPTAMTSNCPTAPVPDNNYCLKASSGNTITYSDVLTAASPQTFRLANTKGTTSYSTTDATSPTVVTTAASCPSGFIPVPGSGTYGTSDFCVMKYEAKDAGSSVPISQAAGTPWVNISQTTAIANSPNVAGCTGCHLITEAEWLTIVQNVLSVNTNWSNNTIGGANYIYSGHNNNIPTGAQVANPSDANGYAGTNSAPNQRRTLTLTNGEVIWDMAGNVWDWTSGTVQSPIIQPGIAGAGYNWREWNAATTAGTLAVNPFPSYGTPAASNWNAGTNGIGRLYSSSDEAGLRGFIRGGLWTDGSYAGVLTLNLNAGPGGTDSSIGFRVSR